jgi:hypothetical protein
MKVDYIDKFGNKMTRTFKTDAEGKKIKAELDAVGIKGKWEW